MKAPGDILLISCYELGHQPLNLASPLAVLRQAGYAPVAVDTSVDTLDDAAIRAARLVAISVPMHTALRLGVAIAERVRLLNPAAHICFYGLYASLNGDYLLREYADSVIGGEFEEALLALAQALASGEPLAIPGVRTRDVAAAPILKRLPFVQPARETLPAGTRYAYLVRDGRAVRAGYVEASRGCLHTCRHCPITPVYGGRFFVVPREIVLEDIRAQVRRGTSHLATPISSTVPVTRWPSCARCIRSFLMSPSTRRSRSSISSNGATSSRNWRRSAVRLSSRRWNR